jgi:hypothetical protein
MPGLDGAEPPLPGVLDTDFGEFLRSFEATAHPRLRLGFRAGSFAAVWIAPVLIRRVPPITRLSPAARERALEALSKTRIYPLRQLYGALRLTVALGYAGDERVRRAVGYPAPARPEGRGGVGT